MPDRADAAEHGVADACGLHTPSPSFLKRAPQTITAILWEKPVLPCRCDITPPLV
jgi:hypothetical protein